MALTDKKNVRCHIADDSMLGAKEVTRIEGKCACGARVLVDYDDTVCYCGRHYNLSGQELNPNWIEEAKAEGTYYGEDE